MATLSAAQPVAWDDQIVPALRKKLEAESAQLGKRISVLDQGGADGQSTSSPAGWASITSASATAHRAPPSTPSVQRTGSSSSTSIYATPTRTAARAQSQLHRQRDPVQGSPASPTSPDLAMQKARERARSIRERKLSAAAQAGPLEAAQTTPQPQQHTTPSSAPSHRLRTESTPMRYQPPTESTPQKRDRQAEKVKLTPREMARAKALEVNRRDREQDQLQAQRLDRNGSYSSSSMASSPPAAEHGGERTPQRLDRNGSYPSSSMSTSPPAADHDMQQRARGLAPMDQTAPRLPTAGPSNYADRSVNASTGRYYRSGSVDPNQLTSTRLPHQPIDDDDDVAHRRSQRAATEPPPSTILTDDWDEVLPPAIARRVAQEELMRNDPSLKEVEGLIDVWDRQGRPLNQQQIDSLVKIRRDREKREREQAQQQQQQGRMDVQEVLQPVSSPPPSSPPPHMHTSSSSDYATAPQHHQQQPRNGALQRSSSASSQPAPPPPAALAQMRGLSQQQRRPSQQQQQQPMHAHTEYPPQPQPQPSLPRKPTAPQQEEAAHKAGCCASCLVM